MSREDLIDLTLVAVAAASLVALAYTLTRGRR